MAIRTEQEPWRATGEQRRNYVRDMFADLVGIYDFQNSLMTAGAHHRWRRRAVRMLNLRPGDPALDLCCGTGDFAFELLKGGAGRVAGLDFCEPMLRRAVEKARGRPVTWLLADATRMPVADSAVEAVTIGWGMRNVADIRAAFREMHRVLRPGGRFVMLDMARPRGPLAWPALFVCRVIVPLLGALVGKREAYTYLPRSVETFPKREELAAMAREAGFVRVEAYDLAFGTVCIHLGVKG